MSCIKKQNGGSCNHHQCQFSDESGYECVDLFAGKCEVGLNCVKDCDFSFSEQEKEEVENSQLAEINTLYNYE